MTDHPITPPPELVRQWLADFYGPETMPGLTPGEMALHLAAVAARWGADQELDACCEWLHWQNLATHSNLIPSLRAARRPKPTSLKAQALQALDQADKGLSESEWQQRSDTIRRALEALPND